MEKSMSGYNDEYQYEEIRNGTEEVKWNLKQSESVLRSLNAYATFLKELKLLQASTSNNLEELEKTMQQLRKQLI